MSLADIDDILGGTPRPRSRPKALSDDEPVVSTRTADLHLVANGVSVPWLMKVFRMSRTKVESALRRCPPSGTYRNGGYYYDLAEAAAYLVKPRRDMREFLRGLTAKDLPQELRETFWNAKIKEAKYRVIAGDLWPTPSVLDVLGETFKTIKTTTQLWTDTVEESKGLSIEQRDLMLKLVDRLLDELHTALVTQAKATMTESFIKELDDETEAS